MPDSAMYREYALRCLDVSKTVGFEQKLALVEMARTWHDLALAEEERVREEVQRRIRDPQFSRIST